MKCKIRRVTVIFMVLCISSCILLNNSPHDDSSIELTFETGINNGEIYYSWTDAKLTEDVKYTLLILKGWHRSKEVIAKGNSIDISTDVHSGTFIGEAGEWYSAVILAENKLDRMYSYLKRAMAKNDGNIPSYSILYQLPDAGPSQMMGYLIKTGNGKIIAIDGGTRYDSAQMVELIKAGKENGHVDAWFITHPHIDHIGVLMEVLENYHEINIVHIYSSLFDQDIYKRNEPNSIAAGDNFPLFMDPIKNIYTELSIGDIFQFDDVTLEVLAVKNPEITSNLVNNSSCCFKLYTEDVSVLFLGDMGVEAGRKLLNHYKSTGTLKSDIVQMAHHGQNGVEKNVYEEIAPKIALWPTPEWLWNNQPSGKEPNTGPWLTLVVRRWMEELGVQSFVGYEGFIEIKLKTAE